MKNLKKGFKRVFITVSMFLLILTGLQIIGSSINTGNEQLNQLLSMEIEVKAAELENGLVIKQRQLFSGKIYLQYGGWATAEIFEGEDGRIYKCIDPTTIMNDGYYTKEEFPSEMTYNYINDVTYYTPELKDKLALINYFGDQETPGDVRTFFTMQYMWETINPTQFSLKRYEGMPSGVNESAYNDFKAEIDEKIRTYYTLPSFDNEAVTLKAGESTILTDANSSLDTLKFENKDGFIFEKLSSSQLKVTATNSANTTRVQFKKNIDPQKQYSSVVYRKNGSQTLGLFGISDPLRLRVTFNVVKAAHIEVLKVDEKGNKVAGVVFEQSTKPDFSSDNWEFTTNENGIAKDTWNRGDITVYVREKSVPKHLVKSAEVKKVQLKTNETTRIKFTNKIVRGNIEILKVDGENQAVKIPGAVFELKQGNKVIQTATSNAQGIALFKDVLYGDYTVTEKSSPEGYRLNPAVLNVKVDANNKTYKYNFNNYKIKGSIEVLKVDFEDQNKVLPGVTFALFKDNVEIATAITNAQGIAKFDDLLYGEYVVREKATLNNYVLSNEFKNVSIKNHNEVIKFTMTNNKIYGEIEVLKVAEHDNMKVLPGAVFELRKDGKVIDTQTTNKDGIARFKKVEYGDVEVVEIEAPKGYFLPKNNSQKAKIEVQKQVVKFTAVNEAEPSIQTQAHGEGQQVRELVEPKDKQIITETAQLKDLVVGESYKALLELVDLATKKVVQTREVEFIATATTMTISENFEVNGFEFAEGVTFSEDLLRKNQKGEYELKATHNKTYDDEDQTVKFKKYGKIQVKKIDANDSTKTLSGAEFTLYRDGKVVEVKTSGEDGIVEFDKIIEGVEYELKETNAPLGYILPAESKKVILTAEQLKETVVFEIPNSLLPIIKKKVESGDNSNILVYGLSAMISLVGVFGLRRKEDRD